MNGLASRSLLSKWFNYLSTSRKGFLFLIEFASLSLFVLKVVFSCCHCLLAPTSRSKWERNSDAGAAEPSGKCDWKRRL